MDRILFFKFYIIILLFASVVFSAEKIPFDALKVEPNFEVFNLRIDLVRQFRTKKTIDVDMYGRITHKIIKTVVPYHPLGVDLGNGLFLDAYLNLSINIIKGLGIEKSKHFRIKLIEANKSSIIYTKHSKKGSVNMLDRHNESFKLSFNRKGVIVKGGFISSRQDIWRKKRTIFYDPHGHFGLFEKAYIKKVGGGVKMPGYWYDETFRIRRGRYAKLGDALYIYRKGNRIQIRVSSWLGRNNVYTLIRQKGRLLLSDKNKSGFILTFNSKKIKIVPYGGFMNNKKRVYSLWYR